MPRGWLDLTASYQSSNEQNSQIWRDSVESILLEREKWLIQPEIMAQSAEAMRLLPGLLLSLDYFQEDYEFHGSTVAALMARGNWTDRADDRVFQSLIESFGSYFQVTGNLSLWEQAKQVSPAFAAIVQERIDTDEIGNPVFHGGSSMATLRPSVYTLLAMELGLTAAEPGFTCVRFAPNPGSDTASRCAGSLPLPAGVVTALYEARADHCHYRVSVPTGLHLQPILPADATDLLFVNGEPVDDDSKIRWTDTSVELAVLPGSEYIFEVVRSRE